jgi:hypothetical protein
LRKKATTKLCSRYGKNNEKNGVKKKDRKNVARRGGERERERETCILSSLKSSSLVISSELFVTERGTKHSAKREEKR